MKIASSAAIREAEQALFASGRISSLELMDQAIDRLVREWRKLPQSQFYTRVALFVGSGNNGGDALGFAAKLGIPCAIFYASDPLSPDAQEQMNRYIDILQPDDFSSWKDAGNILIIDGLLGSGAQGELRPHIAEMVKEINELRSNNAHSCVLSIDIPTGLGTGTCVEADITAPIGCVKPELLLDKSTRFVGRLMPIELPEVEIEGADETSFLSSAPGIRHLFAKRDYEYYKNLAGHLHIVAGSIGMLGAAELCAHAALKAGAGLVTLYALPDCYPHLAARLAPEIMLQPINSYADIALPKASALLVGPGLGRPNKENTEALRRVVENCPCPLILDADGIHLAIEGEWQMPNNTILTPHEGEMRALAGPRKGARVEWAKSFIQKHYFTLLLKGARSLVMNSSGSCCYNSTGGPFMANGGQGDALAGCIAGLAAQKMHPIEAAVAGAYLCGLAAEYARADAGMPPAVSASQVIAQLQRAMGSI